MKTQSTLGKAEEAKVHDTHQHKNIPYFKIN